MRKTMHEKGMQNLVTAILKCAVDDYMSEYKDIIKEPTQKKADYIRILRQYFEENCCGLTYIGEALADRAEMIVREKFSEEMLLEADKVYNTMLQKVAA